MSNLDNTEILSDDLFKAIYAIKEKCPDVVFGGSIALNAVGLLNRKISDIDAFFHYGSHRHNGWLNVPGIDLLSDTVTDTNGNLIQRTGMKVFGVKCCAFKVSPQEMEHSKITVRGIEIKIQNVNYAIAAKIAYS